MKPPAPSETCACVTHHANDCKWWATRRPAPAPSERRVRCVYCGAKLRRDADGPFCPTKNCQWSLTGSGVPTVPAPAPSGRCDNCGCPEGDAIHDEEYERGGHNFFRTPPVPAPGETLHSPFCNRGRCYGHQAGESCECGSRPCDCKPAPAPSETPVKR
jgi:hypothetical protein